MALFCTFRSSNRSFLPLSLFSLFSCHIFPTGFLFPSVEQDLSQVLAGSSRCHYTAESFPLVCPPLNPASVRLSQYQERYAQIGCIILMVETKSRLRRKVCLCVCAYNASLIDTRAAVSLSGCRFCSHVELCLTQP